MVVEDEDGRREQGEERAGEKELVYNKTDKETNTCKYTEQGAV